MGLLSSLRKTAIGPRPGDRYEGSACYCDDYQLVPRPGYYALDGTGKNILADVPLVMVDDRPGEDYAGDCHYEYAGPKDNPQRRARIVSLEADVEGRGGVGA